MFFSSSNYVLDDCWSKWVDSRPVYVWSQAPPRHLWGIFKKKWVTPHMSEKSCHGQTPRNLLVLRNYDNEQDAHQNSVNFDVLASSPSLN